MYSQSRQYLYSPAQVREMDRLAINKYNFDRLALMKRAGESVFQRLAERYPGSKRIAIVCGAGNNGGDGYVVARMALLAGWNVSVKAISEPVTESAKAACNEYLEIGGAISQDLQLMLEKADIVVDALLGTGLSRAPSQAYATAIRAINTANIPVVAIDLPTGLDAASGNAPDACIQANLTVTFIGLKAGMFTAAGKGLSGKIDLDDLGLPVEIHNRFDPVATIIPTPRLSQLPVDTHKGQCGALVIAGGGVGMLGAVILAGKAALRSGSGLVSVLSTESHLDLPALVCPELMSFDLNHRAQFVKTVDRCDVIVLGPGMGRSAWSEQVFDALISLEKPKVLDADALNWLAKKPAHGQRWILTPHPGEAARLLNCSTAEVQSHRLHAAVAIAKQFGGVCVLKGAGTVVADSRGEVSICCQGNPGMATAGMGDVLSGIIGSFLGQGLGLLESAQAGVWLHANCADRQVERTGERSLIADDVIDMLPRILKSIS